MAKLISVLRLMEEKNPKLAARIPAVAFALLERVAHQREVNRYILQTWGLKPREALDWALETLGISCSFVEGSGTALPESGRITMVANHPHGGADALILLDLLTRTYGEAVVPANDLVQHVAPLAPFFAPINKHGSNREYYRRIDALFASDTPLLLFPAGRTGRPAGRGIRGAPIVDFPWTGTFLKKSRRYGRTIVPVHIRGRNSTVFYTVARLRTLLKIRLNLEMLLLVDELMKQRGRIFEAIIGPPIDSARLDRQRSAQEWADAVRSYVGALGRKTRNDFFSWLAAEEGIDEMG